MTKRNVDPRWILEQKRDISGKTGKILLSVKKKVAENMLRILLKIILAKLSGFTKHISNIDSFLFPSEFSSPPPASNP